MFSILSLISYHAFNHLNEFHIFAHPCNYSPYIVMGEDNPNPMYQKSSPTPSHSGNILRIGVTIAFLYLSYVRWRCFVTGIQNPGAIKPTFFWHMPKCQCYKSRLLLANQRILHTNLRHPKKYIFVEANIKSKRRIHSVYAAV